MRSFLPSRASGVPLLTWVPTAKGPLACIFSWREAKEYSLVPERTEPEPASPAVQLNRLQWPIYHALTCLIPLFTSQSDPVP